MWFKRKRLKADFTKTFDAVPQDLAYLIAKTLLVEFSHPLGVSVTVWMPHQQVKWEVS